MTRTPDGHGRERRTDTILPSVLSAREHGCPPPRPDRLPSPRGGRTSYKTESAAGRRAGFARLAGARRGLLRSAGALAAAALLALFGGLALPATAQAQEIVLVSNIAEQYDGEANITSPTFSLGNIEIGEQKVAQRFTTGPNTAEYVLQSVTLGLTISSGEDQVVHVAIHENNSSGDPGAQLAVLDNPAGPIGVNRTYSAPSPLSLVAGTPYWVVLSNTATTSSSVDVSHTQSNDQTTTHGFSIRDTRHQGTPGSWGEVTEYAVRMEVRGTGTVTPPRGICGRTQQVREAIVGLIPSVSDCANVTATHLAAITDLDKLRDTKISALAAGDFDGLTSLNRLWLDRNSLTELPADVFDGLTMLDQLYLGENPLTELPADVFDGLTMLDDLRLNDNQLTALPADVFDGLTALGYLHLTDNQLTQLPDGVFDELTALTFLTLGDNSLTGLPAGVFDKLTVLDGLDLYNNSLTGLPAGVFDKLTVLDGLLLHDNSLTGLPAGVFDNLTVLRGLSLDNNSLEELPAGVFDNLTALEELYLYENPLALLRAGVFDNLTALRLLELRDNQLTELPAGVFDNLTALQYLYLGGNSLTGLRADVFDGLTALIRLELHDNQLQSLPDGLFSGLASLTYFYLGGNLTNPMELTVTVEKVGTNQVRAKVLAGAPFAVDIPVTLVDGTLAASATMLRVAAGAVEGTAVTVTRTAGTTEAVTVDVDLSTPPTLPSSEHRGYAFAKATTGLPATILPSAVDATSTDATLSDLVVNDGSADLVTFVSGTTTYTAMVVNAVAEVTVTAMTTNSGATIEYLDGDDATLTDAGTADGHQVTLAEGDNVIKVKVTAADGNTTQTYTVTVTRAADTDTTAPTLTSASVAARSGGSTTLQFSEDLDLTVGEALSAAARGAFSLTVNGVARDIPDISGDFLTAKSLVVYHSTIYSGQTVVVSYDQSAAGTDAIADAAGNEVADFTTGQDGVPAVVNKSTQAAPVSSDATLSDLVVNDGSADLVTFVSGTTTYTASVASTVAEVTVTPTLNDSGATIEYLDGDDATLTDAGTADGHQVALAVGDNVIKVKVTATDGNTTQTYTVTVTRPAATIPPGREVTLQLSDDAVIESSAPVTVTATVSPASPVAFTVTISATPVAPATADDFTLSQNRVLRFAANATESTGTVTIGPVDDDVPEPTDVVRVSGAVSNAAIPDPADLTFSITNDDSEALDIAVRAPAAVDEDAGAAVVTVTLTTRKNTAPMADTELFYVGKPGETATRGDDYTPPPGSVFGGLVYFATVQPSAFSPNAAGTAWVAEPSFTIGIIDDQEAERAETIVFEVLFGVDRSPVQTITIRDNDGIGPNRPTDLEAAAKSPTVIQLSWTAPSAGSFSITGYRVEASENASGPWVVVAADTRNTRPSWGHGGLSAGDTRYYRVSAISPAGTSGRSNVASATTIAAGPAGTNAALPPPQDVNAEPKLPGEIRLSWWRNPDAASHDLVDRHQYRYRVRDAGAWTVDWTTVNQTQTMPPPGTTETRNYNSVLLQELTAGTTYEFQVRAVDKADGTSAAVAALGTATGRQTVWIQADVGSVAGRRTAALHGVARPAPRPDDGDRADQRDRQHAPAGRARPLWTLARAGPFRGRER